MVNEKDLIEYELHRGGQRVPPPNNRGEYLFVLHNDVENNVLIGFDRRAQLRFLGAQEDETYVAVRKVYDHNKFLEEEYEESDYNIIRQDILTNKNNIPGDLRRLFFIFITKDFLGIRQLIDNTYGVGDQNLCATALKIFYNEIANAEINAAIGDIIIGRNTYEDTATIEIEDYEINLNERRCFFIGKNDKEKETKIRFRDVFNLIYQGSKMKAIKYKSGVQIKTGYNPSKENALSRKTYYGIYLGELPYKELLTKNKKDSNLKVPILIRYKDVKKVVLFDLDDIKISPSYEAYRKICTFKVKSSDASGHVFGYAKLKSKLVGSYIQVIDYLPSFKCKKDKRNRDVLLVRTEAGREVKFLVEDIEIVYPKLNFTPKLDRTIRKQGIVICKNSKHSKAEKGNFYEVLQISNNKSSPKLNVLTLRCLETNNVICSYQRNFKVNEECFSKLEEKRRTKGEKVEEEKDGVSLPF